MGDGVLVYFGYPEAHEDDAKRAVRAGLAVIEAVDRFDLPVRLQVGLGVASGPVVVGDLIGEGAARERGVVGCTAGMTPECAATASARGSERCSAVSIARGPMRSPLSARRGDWPTMAVWRMPSSSRARLTKCAATQRPYARQPLRCCPS
jgi:hypothetical protein